jgi:hypothetical protein
MHTAIATLQRVVQQRLLAGMLNRAKYVQVTSQLREIADELFPERRSNGEKSDPVNFADILHSVVGARQKSDVLLEAPEGVLVDGPEHDLRELIDNLTEFARNTRTEPVELRASVSYGNDQDHAKCVTELVIQAPDVPDFLRRKLWNVITVRRGQVSIECEAHRCRVEFSLPIERRIGTVLG